MGRRELARKPSTDTGNQGVLEGALEPLRADMCVVYGLADEDTVEIAEALARIRITLDGTHREAPGA